MLNYPPPKGRFFNFKEKIMSIILNEEVLKRLTDQNSDANMSPDSPQTVAKLSKETDLATNMRLGDAALSGSVKRERFYFTE